MDRILIFSDTHGSTKKALEIFDNLHGVTAVIHLGDLARDSETIKDHVSPIPFYGVTGNNDFFSPYPDELELEISGKKFFLTHGHKYSCNYGTQSLEKKAEENGYDVVLFGHTHYPHNETVNGVLYANPGSISFPRVSDPSYGILEIENGKIGYSNIFIDFF